MSAELELRATIADVASDSDLAPDERVRKLRELGEGITDAELLGQIEGYIGSLELRREAIAIEQSVMRLALRENADIRDALLASGQATEEELDQAGYLSHEELDAREEDGSLLEAITLEEVGLRDVLRWTKGFEKGGQFRPTRGGSAGRRVTKATSTGREKGSRKAEKPKKQSKKPSIQERLAEVQAQGLNDWPTLGPVGRKILGKAKDTRILHTVPVPASPGTTKLKGQREYTPQRAKLHSTIMGGFFAEGVADLLGADDPIVSKLRDEGIHALTRKERQTIRSAAEERREGPKPTALFMAGGPASGKTSALAASPELKPPASVEINSDDVKVLLPEFIEQKNANERAAAASVHEESSDVAKSMIVEASDLGLNVVMDGTGNSEPGKFEAKLREMFDDGYEVDVLGVTVSTDEAVVRAYDRAVSSGRWVPEPEIRKSHALVSANFPSIIEADWIRSVTLYDNAGPSDEPPRLIGNGQAGEFVIEDEPLMNQFLAKADEMRDDTPDDPVQDLAPDVTVGKQRRDKNADVDEFTFTADGKDKESK